MKDGKLYAVVSVPDEVWRVSYRIIREWSGEKKILQRQGKVSEFYFESGKIEILKKRQGKLKLTL